jgi:hypothetical protein
MFAQRPAKQIYEKLEDNTVDCKDVKAPQAICIEKCNRTVFNVHNKVTSISLLNCTECTLKFPSVVSTVEIIRSSDILIQCSDTCNSYTLDEANDCEIEFPRSAEADILFVSIRSEGCALIAKPSDSNSGDIKTAQEQRFTIVETAHSHNAAEAAAATQEEEESSATNASVQYRTTYKNDSFTTDKLERSGTIGYFSNN